MLQHFHALYTCSHVLCGVFFFLFMSMTWNTWLVGQWFFKPLLLPDALTFHIDIYPIWEICIIFYYIFSLILVALIAWSFPHIFPSAWKYANGFAYSLVASLWFYKFFIRNNTYKFTWKLIKNIKKIKIEHCIENLLLTYFFIYVLVAHHHDSLIVPPKATLE